MTKALNIRGTDRRTDAAATHPVWWVRFWHPDEPRTRINPHGERLRLMKISGWMPVKSDFDALYEREGKNIVIMELKHWGTTPNYN